MIFLSNIINLKLINIIAFETIIIENLWEICIDKNILKYYQIIVNQNINYKK